MDKRIIILVGPPGVGKSTWVQKEFQDECRVISSDNIIEEVAKSEGKTYNEVFSKYIKAADAMMWQDFDGAVNGDYYPIIVDRTNMSAAARGKFFARLNNFHKGHGYTVEAVVFPMPGTEKLSSEEWNRRLDSRPGKTIPNHVLTSMIEHYQPPTLSEGFSKIEII